ncbi:MAG: hypothetical protein WDO70_00020 [Alphaproteobacteria bacterium]
MVEIVKDTYRTAVNGMMAAGERVSAAANKIANLPVTGGDPTESLLQIKVAQIEQRANAAVIKAQSENERHLMDVIA